MPQLHQRRCSAWHGRHHCSKILNTELFFAITFRRPNIFAAESLLIMSPSLVWCWVCVYTDLSTVKPFLGNGPEPLTLIRPFATSTGEKEIPKCNYVRLVDTRVVSVTSAASSCLPPLTLAHHTPGHHHHHHGDTRPDQPRDCPV